MSKASQHTRRPLTGALLLAACLCACAAPPPVLNPTPDPTPGVTAPPATDTVTLAAPTLTPPAPTASASATRPPTRSPTSTLAPTQTPSASLTPRPTSTLSPPTVTSTVTPPAAPLFPGTPLVPFDRGTFISSLQQVRASMHTFVLFWLNPIANGNPGNCGDALRERDHWLNAFGFTGVPAEWVPLYVQYRTALQVAVAGVEPLVGLCAQGGGSLAADTLQAIYAAMETAQSQLYQIELQAGAMP